MALKEPACGPVRVALLAAEFIDPTLLPPVQDHVEAPDGGSMRLSARSRLMNGIIRPVSDDVLDFNPSAWFPRTTGAWIRQ